MPTTPRENAAPAQSFEQRINQLAGEYVTADDSRVWTDMLALCTEAFEKTTTPGEAKSVWISIMTTCLPIPTKRNLANIAIAAVYEPHERQEGELEVSDARFATRLAIQGRVGSAVDRANMTALRTRGYLATRGWNPRQVLG